MVNHIGGSRGYKDMSLSCTLSPLYCFVAWIATCIKCPLLPNFSVASLSENIVSALDTSLMDIFKHVCMLRQTEFREPALSGIQYAKYLHITLFQTIRDIKAACEEAGVSMPQASLSWLLEQDPVKSVIVGASTPQQLEQTANLVTLQQVTFLSYFT